ncbi:MAG TPA: VanW family protein [Gaiellaceae bacterium]|nr:VanW family protein [Gaiellaceae bacterium]
MRAQSPLYTRARQRRRTLSTPAAFALGAGVVAALVVLVGLAFAGSRSELAAGTQVAGVDVGGLTRREAIAKLDALFEERSDEPIAFVAGESRYSFAANQLGVQPDWAGAVTAAERAGDGFGPLRGFRRLRARVFGAEVLPRLAVSNAALEYALDRIADDVNRPSKSAAVVRRGLRVSVAPQQAGRRLERDAAAEVVVRALGALERTGSAPTRIPVATTRPPVTAAMLAGAAERARIALSAPVTLKAPNRTFRLPRWRIARLLELPRGGATRLAIGGPAADAYFRSLSARIGRPARDATFAVYGDAVQVVPSRDGLELNVPRAARAILRAATRPANRVAQLTVVRAAPERTTAEALAMGIDTRMASYKTYYSGTADRITNLQLGVRALDGTLVEPGGTFSLNEAIGERTEERGFRPAPVIIGNEYEEEVGGGTSQVATTAFNAAWEAGLKITERHPHSLYISRYQLGRDATVYWPSLDLKFVNDTKSWVLVRGFVEGDGISIAIYGGERRRVESSAAPLVVTGRIPVERVEDPTLPVGERVVEEEGVAPTRTSASRKVYSPDGELLHDETWTTSYDAEEKVVRIGTKVVPKPKPTAKPKAAPAEESADTTETPVTPRP